MKKRKKNHIDRRTIGFEKTNECYVTQLQLFIRRDISDYEDDGNDDSKSVSTTDDNKK